ncbi:MAG: hexose kinase [Actinomycetota bacterium]|nr:hexose kinase [Actinomycetota bacterium]
MLTVTLNPSLDLSASVPVVEPERKLRCTEPVGEAGGGGVNVARVALRLGRDAVALFPSGGSNGAAVATLLAAEGVKLRLVDIDGSTRSSLAVTDASNGHQYRFSMPGPTLSDAERAEIAVAVEAAAADQSVVVISGSNPPGTPEGYIAELIGRCGDARVVVDTSGPALAEAAAAGVALVKPNVNELVAFAGEELHDQHAYEAAGRQLLALGATEAALISLGPAGALLIEHDGPATRIPAPSVRVVSTVGAGDSMVAGASTALDTGQSMVDAARLGVAAGAAAVITPGTELCRPADIERLLPLTR